MKIRVNSQGSRQPSQRTKPPSMVARRRLLRGVSCKGGALALLLMLAALISAGPALAEHPCAVSGNSVDGVCAETIGTGSATVLKATTTQGGYRAITIDNESTTASIAVCFGASCIPAINTAGSFTIGPSMTRTWTTPYGAGGGFNDPMNAIASAASTPVTTQAQ